MRDFAEEEGTTFTVLLDEQAKAARAYEVRGIPASFFIDREGVIRIRHKGPLDEMVIERYAEQLLK